MRIEAIDEPLTPEEMMLISQIKEIQQAYLKAAEPYQKRLAAIRARKIPKYVLMPEEQAHD